MIGGAQCSTVFEDSYHLGREPNNYQEYLYNLRDILRSTAAANQMRETQSTKY